MTTVGNCKLCRGDSAGDLCRKCADNISYYKRKKTVSSFDMKKSPRCNYVVDRVNANKLDGLWVPEWWDAPLMPAGCQHCGTSFERVDDRVKLCKQCTERQRKFSLLKGQKKTHRSSPQMYNYYIKYCEIFFRIRDGEALSIPLTFERYLQAIPNPFDEYSRWLETKDKMEAAARQEIEARQQQWLNE